jgi:LysM repeat protein
MLLLFTVGTRRIIKAGHIGLKRAGYATNPKYPQILITNIEKYNLQQFDALTDSPVSTEAIAVVTSDKQEVMKVATVPPADIPLPLIEIRSNTKFNGLKAYFAAKGTSLLAIATTADIPLVKLLEYNDLSEDGLTKEIAWVYLEKKAKQGNRDIYTALQDESLYSIAQNNGVQLQSLSRLNELPETARVKKGTKIKLRPSQQLTMSN